MFNKFIDWTAFVLVVVGGINWGLVGAFDYNVITVLFGAMPVITTTIYVLVGIAALVMLFNRFKKNDVSLT